MSEESCWSRLPAVVLESVISLLPPRDRHSMSLVCRTWSQVLLSPRAWTTLNILPRTFTSKHYTLQLGYHRRLDDQKVRNCLENVGHHIRRLVIYPMDNYLHLQELMDVLYVYKEWIMVKEFSFTYECETRNRSGSYLHGIGEPVLNKILDLLTHFDQNLTTLSLNNLLLSRETIVEFQERLVNIVPNIGRLELRNSTSDGAFLHIIGAMKHLHTYITSPQQIDDILLLKLCENGVKMLHLVQDKYTGYAAPITRQTWQRAGQTNPDLRVKLICTGGYKHDVLVQQGAPVSHVIYDTPHSVISPVTIWSISDYTHTLTFYGHKSLPKLHGRSSNDRADSLLLLLIENCPNLNTLIIRARVSSASILLIGKKCEKLRRLYVRRGSILTRLDWSQEEGWSDEFYTWLKKSCKSLGRMEEEVGRMLGYTWRTLSDGEFEQLSDIDL